VAPELLLEGLLIGLQGVQVEAVGGLWALLSGDGAQVKGDAPLDVGAAGVSKRFPAVGVLSVLKGEQEAA